MESVALYTPLPLKRKVRLVVTPFASMYFAFIGPTSLVTPANRARYTRFRATGVAVGVGVGCGPLNYRSI
jgi:hypothetical protein